MLKKCLFLFIFLSSTVFAAESIHIVAAENFYGQIAQQIGGEYVIVESILKNPKQDPHLFSTNPATAKAIANANIIIYNGLDYDSWMENLIQLQTKKTTIIKVADLLHKKNGANPHIWYDPNTMLVYSAYLTQELIKLDPINKTFYQNQLQLFKKQYQVLLKQIEQDKIKFHNTPVIATEPVFNDMAEALGLTMHGLSFQISIMNDTEPSAADIKDFQNQLKNKTVSLLIMNNQVSDPLTQRMQEIAAQVNIPVIGVSETQPLDQNYIQWMTMQLSAVEKALGEK